MSPLGKSGSFNRQGKDKDNGNNQGPDPYAGPTAEFVLLSSTGIWKKSHESLFSWVLGNKNELTNIPDGTLPQPGVLHFFLHGEYGTILDKVRIRSGDLQEVIVRYFILFLLYFNPRSRYESISNYPPFADFFATCT